MKYVIGISLVLGVLGCNAPTEAPQAVTKVAASPIPAAPSCAFDSMVLNGASASAPGKTSYICNTVPSNPAANQYVYIALRTDGTAYFGIGAAGVGVTPLSVYWAVDDDACEVLILNAPSTGNSYRLRAPSLLSDGKLSAVDVKDMSNGSILPTSQCYYDMTPGF